MPDTLLIGQIGYQIARTNRQLELDLEARLKPLSLSVDQFRILRCLGENGRLPMGELASSVFVEPANLTKIIDRMTSENLVMRVPDDKDRRRVLVTLAPEGTAKNATLGPIIREHDAYARDMLAAEDGDPLRRLLAGIKVSG
ncbi:MAG: MarR family transcriptional regulator [Rhodobacteraceae bacterium]|nr:MarR family transcriptional regulator [Paracoccaceae bacterium]